MYEAIMTDRRGKVRNDYVAQAVDDVSAALKAAKIEHEVVGNNDSGYIRIIIGKDDKKMTLYFGEGEDLP